MVIALALLEALIVTILIEGTAMYLWSRNRDWVYYSFLCNCMTNPMVNVLLACAYHYTDLGYYGPLAVLELAAWLSEALVYKHLCGFPWGKALILSAVLNGLSYGIGLLVL